MKFSSHHITANLISLALALSLTACGSKSSDEDQVRALIASAEDAAESRDASDVLDLVAPDYSDSQGLDRATLENFLRGYFLAHPKLELLVDIHELEFPADGLARARVTVAMVGTTADGKFSGAAGDLQTLNVELRRLDGQWRVARADRASP